MSQANNADRGGGGGGALYINNSLSHISGFNPRHMCVSQICQCHLVLPVLYLQGMANQKFWQVGSLSVLAGLHRMPQITWVMSHVRFHERLASRAHRPRIPDSNPANNNPNNIWLYQWLDKQRWNQMNTQILSEVDCVLLIFGGAGVYTYSTLPTVPTGCNQPWINYPPKQFPLNWQNG